MLVNIQLKPSARRDEILEERGDFLRIAVSAPAHEGRANAELLKFLKKEKGWRAEIVKGKTSKTKVVRVLNE